MARLALEVFRAAGNLKIDKSLGNSKHLYERYYYWPGKEMGISLRVRLEIFRTFGIFPSS